MTISFGKRIDPDPCVALSSNGTKLVGVYDNRVGYSRTFRVSEQEADDFISNRKKTIKKTKWRNVLLMLLGGVAGGIIGYKTMKNPIMTGLSVLAGSGTGEILGGLLGSPKKAGIKVTEKFIDKNLEKSTV